MNIIFLDMDGVLNCSDEIKKWQAKYGSDEQSLKKFKEKFCLNTKGPYLYFIVPKLLKRFNNMYSKIPNCKIVWSSSWRTTTKKDSKLFIEDLFYRCGFPKDSFLSYTPELRYTLRRDEIKQWLNIFKSSYKIEKCVIIDDMLDADPGENELFGIPIKFFHTSMEDGLTEEISNKILNYFMEKKDVRDK